MEIPILQDITIIFSVSALALIICGWIRVPEVLGYLVTGLLIGPGGLGLIHATHEVEIMAEIGVVLLLFTVGLEFSLAHLISLKRPALAGGGFQVLFTVLITALFSYLIIHKTLGLNMFFGMMASVSSTAIVLKILGGQKLLDAPHGRISTAILIFQDIAVIPMILAIPLLAGAGGNPGKELGILGIKAIGLVAVVFIAARTVAPKLLFHVANFKNRELFMVVIVLLGLGIAMLTSKVGLSLALGAFLAGIVVSESGYGQQALGSLIPFKDIFTGFFFVSIGMLIDLNIFAQYAGTIAIATFGVIFVKMIIAGVAVSMIGYPLKTALLVGFALSQVGEFSFIMAKAAESAGLFDGDIYKIAIAVIVSTMAISPFFIMASGKIADWATTLPFPAIIKNGYIRQTKDEHESLKDHVIIVGFGVAGRAIAKAAKQAEIPYIVIEMNPSTIKKKGEEPIIYGDASSFAVLEHAHIEKARVLVATIPDPVGVRNIVDTAKQENPAIHVVARTRFVLDQKPLKSLGADDVVVEEFETSVELFAKVLAKYLIPEKTISRMTRAARSGNYCIFTDDDAATMDKLDIPGIDISTIKLPEKTFADGKTLGELKIRNQFGVTIVAVKKGDVAAHAEMNTVLHAGDEIVAMGTHDNLTVFSDAIKDDSDD